MAIASLVSVSYRYPAGQVQTLRNASIEIERGLTLVTGNSGSGKSTFLRVFNGLVPHFHGGRTSGRAVVAGKDIFVTPVRELARHVGFVFQDPELQSVYTIVERDVAFGLENLGVTKREMHTRVDAALHTMGVEHLRQRDIATLSGGERQRIALASILAMQPSLIVLDEPTSQLDSNGEQSIATAVTQLARSGVGIVVSEHRVAPFLASATARAHLTDGVLVSTVVEQNRSPITMWESGDGVARQRVARTDAWSLTNVVAGPRGLPLVEIPSLYGGVGEIVVLMGANGTGKTMLLRTLAGLVPPYAGDVTRCRGRVAYLPQNPAALLSAPTVLDEVVSTLGGRKDTDVAVAMLRALNIEHLAHRYTRDVSSGERQRVAIAAVLVGNPSIALLDEPTRGMDTSARNALCRVVRSLASEGCSVVIATHDIDLATSLGDWIVNVGEGRVTEVGVSTLQGREMLRV